MNKRQWAALFAGALTLTLLAACGGGNTSQPGSASAPPEEPDISVICDKDKLSDRGCEGAPDWIIEITSPSTSRMDYSIKLFKYRTAGVREYWIVNPITKIVQTYCFEGEEDSCQHTFDDPIQTHIFDDLTIKISDFLP